MEKKITINCDGGSRGNPGLAASAFVVTDNQNKELFSKGMFLGHTTNNVAEYNAVLMAVEWLDKNKDTYKSFSIEFILDSELVVRQLSGIYKIKNEKLKELSLSIMKIKKTLPMTIVFKNVLREKNKSADSLVNETLDRNS